MTGWLGGSKGLHDGDCVARLQNRSDRCECLLPGLTCLQQLNWLLNWWGQTKRWLQSIQSLSELMPSTALRPLSPNCFWPPPPSPCPYLPSSSCPSPPSAVSVSSSLNWHVGVELSRVRVWDPEIIASDPLCLGLALNLHERRCVSSRSALEKVIPILISFLFNFIQIGS